MIRATSIKRALGRGRALKIETFFYPEMATSEASAFWAKKSLFGVNNMPNGALRHPPAQGGFAASYSFPKNKK